MRISKNNTVKKPKVGYFVDFDTKYWSIFKIFLIFLFFTLITFVIYSNTFDSPFVLDDLRKIEENPGIRVNQLSLTEIVKAGFKSSRARPVAFMTLALNYSLHQYDVFGYHVINISIHVLTGFFLFLFLKTTFRIPVVQERYKHSDLICFFAALIWLVHPLQTQSVTYIVQRANSMATMFFILSFFFYSHGRLTYRNKNKWVWFIASAIAWLISLACKQISAILPFMVFLYEWFFFQDLSKDWIKKYLKHLLGITVVFALLVLVYTDFSPFEKIKKFYDYANNEFTISDRLLTQSRVIVYYISLIIFSHPSRLNLDYDYALSHSLIDPITTILAFGAICGLIVLAVYFAKKERLIAFCMLWFFGTHLIESSIIPLAIIFEHRNYLPSMLVCLIPVVLAYRYIKLDWIKIGLLGALVILLSVWTYQRNHVWGDKTTLWSDVVEKSPNKPRPNFNLGAALTEQERDQEAIPYYKRALDLNPNLEQPHINLGEALERQGKTDEALEHYRIALKLNPDLPEAHNNIGGILAKQGRTEEAIRYYQNALKIRPHYALANFNLAGALTAMGNMDQAIKYYYIAIKIKPEYAEAYIKLGDLFLSMGVREKAINHYMAALQIDPGWAEAYNNLGIALMQEGKIEAAIGQFQKALEVKPDFTMAQNNLQRAMMIRKGLEDEISRLHALLKDNPESAELHFEIGNLYFRKGAQRMAMQKYKKALQLNPKFVPAINNLALVTAANREYYKALTIFYDVLNYWPDDAETHYNIACMYARLKRVDESIEWLKKAIDKGYANWESIKRDGDLDNIRDALAYRELIKGH